MQDVNRPDKLRGVTGDPRYKRLGEMVGARRAEVLGSRAKAAAASNVGDQTWVDIEKGVARNYTEAKRRGIMRALGWTFESWDIILDGGEPQVAPENDATRLSRLEARFDLLEAAVRGLLAKLPDGPPSPREP